MWAVAAFVPPLVTGLLSLGRPVLVDSHAALVLVLVVAAVSTFGSSAVGVVAALTGALAYDYCWTEPYGSLSIADASDAITVVLLVLVAVLSAWLSGWVARQRAAAVQQRSYLEAVRTATAARAASDAPESSLRAVCDAVTAVLGVDRCRVARGAGAGSATLLTDGTVVRGTHVVDVDRSGLPTDDVLVLPVSGSGATEVHLEVTAATRVVRPTLEQRQVAALLARLAGADLTTP
jgi:K+-sensing histidine kinase KdpD